MFARSSYLYITIFVLSTGLGNTENTCNPPCSQSGRADIDPILIVHGGAGDIPDDRVPLKMAGVKLAASNGYKILHDSGSILDAVEAAVVTMEDDDAFNAGYGSVLNLDAKVEMEASMQRGSDLRAGCVTLIRDMRHPISIARRVLENTPHSMLGGDGARRFAIEQGFETIDPDSLITEYALSELEDFLNQNASEHKRGRMGTVGAVVINAKGEIAVATSTGGITGKYVGRIGDTPQIGSGTYADDNIGGASMTGHGESILKVSLAYRIIGEIAKGATAQEASAIGIDYMKERLNETAGAITLSKTGDIGIYFSSNRMAWAYVTKNQLHYGIEHGEHNIEDFDVDK